MGVKVTTPERSGQGINLPARVCIGPPPAILAPIESSPTDIVHRGYGAFARGDWDTMREVLHRDVEWSVLVMPLLGIDALRGREETIRFFAETLPENLDEFRADIGRIAPLGPDAVVVETHYSGRGRISGAPFTGIAFGLHLLKDGQVIYRFDFASEDEARAAAQDRRDDG